jgi:hypothetical protein
MLKICYTVFIVSSFFANTRIVLQNEFHSGASSLFYCFYPGFTLIIIVIMIWESSINSSLEPIVARETNTNTKANLEKANPAPVRSQFIHHMPSAVMMGIDHSSGRRAFFFLEIDSPPDN